MVGMTCRKRPVDSVGVGAFADSSGISKRFISVYYSRLSINIVLMVRKMAYKTAIHNVINPNNFGLSFGGKKKKVNLNEIFCHISSYFSVFAVCHSTLTRTRSSS